MELAEKGAPLLLIHGDNDNNSGTHPMQSERMYQAVSGQVCLSHTHTRAPFARSPAHARARAHTHTHTLTRARAFTLWPGWRGEIVHTPTRGAWLQGEREHYAHIG